jgi:hypothetical protein
MVNVEEGRVRRRVDPASGRSKALKGRFFGTS